jgi:hypothetical protein
VNIPLQSKFVNKSPFTLFQIEDKWVLLKNNEYLLDVKLVPRPVFYDRIRVKTEKAVEQFLFKDRYDYRETLGNFSKAMVTILDLKSLTKKIIETITETMGVEKASLFLMDEEKGRVKVLVSIFGLPRTKAKPSSPKRIDVEIKSFLQYRLAYSLRKPVAQFQMS